MNGKNEKDINHTKKFDLFSVVKQITYKSSQRMSIWRKLSLSQRSVVFSALSPYVQKYIAKHLRLNEFVELLDHLDMMQVRRVLDGIGDKKLKKKIIARLQNEVKDKLEYFLRFHPKANLSLVNLNYLFLSEDLTISEVADIINEHYQETTRFPEVLIHREGELVGEIPINLLVKEPNGNKVKKYVKAVETVVYQSDTNKVIELVLSSAGKKVVVLDYDGSVLGIIYVDAIRKLFGNMPAQSLYDFAGVDSSERPFDSALRKVSQRYKWLILNLVTSFFAGFVVLIFQDTLNNLTILSVFIPIIAGMGGNAATQSFAVMLRGLTLGTISLKNSIPALRKEIIAGIINGFIIAFIVFITSFIWKQDLKLSLVVSVALIGAHFVSSIAGTLVPLILKYFGKDPATTSVIVITTITDVVGLLCLLGLATLFLL